jgi:hypothetical protein
MPGEEPVMPGGAGGRRGKNDDAEHRSKYDVQEDVTVWGPLDRSLPEGGTVGDDPTHNDNDPNQT